MTERKSEYPISVNLPGREDVSIHFTLDKAVSNETPYHVKYVRRLAWMLLQALPMHVIEHLIHELMLAAQETILRGARLEAAQKKRRLNMSVKDEVDSPFPGSLQLWFDGDVPEQPLQAALDEGEEFEVGDSATLEDEEDE